MATNGEQTVTMGANCPYLVTRQPALGYMSCHICMVRIPL